VILRTVVGHLAHSLGRFLPYLQQHPTGTPTSTGKTLPFTREEPTATDGRPCLSHTHARRHSRTDSSSGAGAGAGAGAGGGSASSATCGNVTSRMLAIVSYLPSAPHRSGGHAARQQPGSPSPRSTDQAVCWRHAMTGVTRCPRAPPHTDAHTRARARARRERASERERKKERKREEQGANGHSLLGNALRHIFHSPEL
jgi:hypothetical protein